jgi:hypothetical protein
VDINRLQSAHAANFSLGLSPALDASRTSMSRNISLGPGLLTRYSIVGSPDSSVSSGAADTLGQGVADCSNTEILLGEPPLPQDVL